MCTPKKYETGHRFGHLILIAPLPARGSVVQWRMVCDCGAEVTRVISSCIGSLGRGQKVACKDCTGDKSFKPPTGIGQPSGGFITKCNTKFGPISKEFSCPECREGNDHCCCPMDARALESQLVGRGYGKTASVIRIRDGKPISERRAS